MPNLADILASFERADAAANQANEARYGEILTELRGARTRGGQLLDTAQGQYEGRVGGVADLLETSGRGAMREAGRRFEEHEERAGAAVCVIGATVQREQEAQGVALEKEAVEQISATYAFKANLQILRAQDETMGSLLDTKA